MASDTLAQRWCCPRRFGVSTLAKEQNVHLASRLRQLLRWLTTDGRRGCAPLVRFAPRTPPVSQRTGTAARSPHCWLRATYGGAACLERWHLCVTDVLPAVRCAPRGQPVALATPQQAVGGPAADCYGTSQLQTEPPWPRLCHQPPPSRCEKTTDHYWALHPPTGRGTAARPEPCGNLQAPRRPPCRSHPTQRFWRLVGQQAPCTPWTMSLPHERLRLTPNQVSPCAPARQDP